MIDLYPPAHMKVIFVPINILYRDREMSHILKRRGAEAAGNGRRDPGAAGEAHYNPRGSLT